MLGLIKDYFHAKSVRTQREREREEQQKLDNQKRTLKRMMDILNIEEEISRKKIYHAQQIEKHFPLQRGDILLLENGHEYRVCMKEMRGILNQNIVKLKLVNELFSKSPDDPNMDIKEKIHHIEAKRMEELKFQSMEHLNQYWIEKKGHIRRITKQKEIAF